MGNLILELELELGWVDGDLSSVDFFICNFPPPQTMCAILCQGTMMDKIKHCVVDAV